MTGKKLASIFLILALLVDVTGHSVAFGVGLRAHDGGTSKSVAAAPYIEDVFSSYLYTGNASAQTITNGIDLAGKGGMVWIKDRTSAIDNIVFDAVRGATKGINTNLTDAEANYTNALTAFTSSGFSIGAPSTYVNTSGDKYASWTFRKAPKFFDVVTWTGNGAGVRQIAHSLGIAPGMIIVKNLDVGVDNAEGYWKVWHKSKSPELTMPLEKTWVDEGTNGIGTGHTASYFAVKNTYSNVNGNRFVAYLFAHDVSANGVIQCGSFTTDGSGNATVNLGWEPQYILYKTVSVAANWRVLDILRGMVANGNNNQVFYPNVNDAEANTTASLYPTATGFGANAIGVTTYIYLAIRRGPMRTPTSGTQVYNAIARTGTGAAAAVTGVGFPPDWITTKERVNAGGYQIVVRDRLRGASVLLETDATSAEDATTTAGLTSFDMGGFSVGVDGIGSYAGTTNSNAKSYINWLFRRAPGVFDVVAYTGTGVAHTESHNLGAVPELVITKSRNNPNNWYTLANITAGGFADVTLNAASAATARGYADNAGFNAMPTATVLNLDIGARLNSNGYTMVAYLFATKAGISKVGSYTGNGASQTINANFTASARFVLIKRTDAAGDWFVWDSVRGIAAGTDPHLSLNTTAVEVTSDDSIDPDSSGFVVNQDAATNINVNGGTYIYLAFQ